MQGHYSKGSYDHLNKAIKRLTAELRKREALIKEVHEKIKTGDEDDVDEAVLITSKYIKDQRYKKTDK